MAKLVLTPAQQAIARGEELDPKASKPDNVKLDDQGFAFEVEAGEALDPERKYIDEIDPGDEEPDDSGLPDWMDEESLEYARSYGLRDEDLNEFKSLDDLHRFGALADKRLAESVANQSQQAPPRDQPAKPESKEGDAPSEDEWDVGELVDPKKYEEEGYDETTVEAMKRLRRLQEMMQRMAPVAKGLSGQVQSQQTEQQAQFSIDFHQTLDELDPAVFGRVIRDGKAQALSDAHDQHRRQVWDATTRLYQGIVETARKEGRQPQLPPPKVLVRRAARLVLGSDVASSGSDLSVDAVREQSRRRRPVSSSVRKKAAPGGSRDGSEDDVSRIASKPDIRKFWVQAQRQNGTA